MANPTTKTFYPNFEIRPVSQSDAPAICDIYNHYIQHSTATFEESLITPLDIEQRISDLTPDYPWLVCLNNNKLVGYAYASRWKERSAYKHTTEVTIYIDPQSTGQGYSSELYRSLLNTLENNFHVAIAVIALPNDASIKVHESFGFKKVAHFEEVGMKFQKWINVGFWQKKLKD